MVDPVFAHWVVLAPVILAVALGLIARRLRYRDEVKECLRYVRKVRRRNKCKRRTTG